MPRFALQPILSHDPVAGLLVSGTDQYGMLEKLRARAAHYADMSFATGDGWSVIFSDANSDEAALPWLKGNPVFLYRLGPGCLCQLGYRPEIPTPLTAALVAKLRKTYAAQGTLALVSGPSQPQLYDLSKARQLAQIDLAALA
jgi:hypothetical protein